MVIENGDPAICVFGVPVLPAVVPPRGVSPGRMTWSFVNEAGFTVMFTLVPVRGGEEKSVHVSRTFEPAPNNVTGPLHTPATNVIWAGVLVPEPVLGPSTASPA